MLFFCSHVVKYDHLHVHPIVTLLEEPLLLTLLTRLLDLGRQLSLDLFYVGFSFQDSLQRVIVLLHFAVNSRLVQVCRYHIVLLRIALVLEDFLFEFDSIGDSS